jgi:hypothetical protein
MVHSIPSTSLYFTVCVFAVPPEARLCSTSCWLLYPEPIWELRLAEKTLSQSAPALRAARVSNASVCCTRTMVNVLVWPKISNQTGWESLEFKNSGCPGHDTVAGWVVRTFRGLLPSSSGVRWTIFFLGILTPEDKGHTFPQNINTDCSITSQQMVILTYTTVKTSYHLLEFV